MAELIRRTLVLSGARHSYLEAGSPGAPVLLLLHDAAYGSDAMSCWDGVAQHFADRYHVIAPDLLGHGESPKTFDFGRDAMSQRLDQVSAITTALGIERAAVVGSSFGGGMLLQAAVRRAWPFLIGGVTISGPGGIHMIPEAFAVLTGYDPSPEAAAELVAMLFKHPPAGEVERRFHATLAPGHWEALSASRLANPAREASTFDWREGYRKGLADVELPILVVAGADDRLLEPGWEQQMAALIPGASPVCIEDAQHMPHLEQPETTLAAINKFLAPLLVG